jgi:thioredoxin reductase (NADPH)
LGREEQVIIVGAGPAGMASAIYLHRAGRTPVLLERAEPGGLLRNANLVENYPGFPGGIKGTDLVGLFMKQLDFLGVKVSKAEVDCVETRRGIFKVLTRKEELSSRALILATGTNAKHVPLPGASGLLRKLVFSEIVDMPLAKISRKRIAILGGGDAAFDYGLNLAGRGAEVTIVARSEPTCLSLLKARAETSGIELITSATVERARLENGVVLISLNDGSNKTDLRADYVVTAWGREPNTDVLKESLKSKIGSGERVPETDVSGLFMAGDVARGGRRQTAIAVGDGVNAAMLTDSYLKTREVRP